MAMVWESGLPKNMKMCLLAYADHANDDGTSVYPGEEVMAEKTSDSAGNVRRVTQLLIKDGVLVQTKRGYRGQRAEFRIVIEVLAAHIARHSEKKKGAHQCQERRAPVSRKARATATPNHHEPSEEPPKVSAKQRTDAFEALYEFWLGKPWKPKTRLTTSQRGKLNAAVKELEQINALDVDEIRRRGNQYRQRWRDVTRSPHGLVANWTLFEPEHTPAPQTPGECVHRWASVTNLDGTESRICMLRCGIPEQHVAQPM